MNTRPDPADEDKPSMPTPEEAATDFVHAMDEFAKQWQKAAQTIADFIVEQFKSFLASAEVAKVLRDVRRYFNPYHRAKFHRHPKRRALRK